MFIVRMSINIMKTVITETGSSQLAVLKVCLILLVSGIRTGKSIHLLHQSLFVGPLDTDPIVSAPVFYRRR